MRSWIRRPTRPRCSPTLRRRLDALAERGGEVVDLALLDDERRRELDRVAAVADVEALREHLHRDLERTLCGLAGKRLDREAGGEAEVADVRDVLRALQRVHGILPVRREL